ncbi:MAG: NAD(P)H-hydrate dehydratase [Caldisericia bacterium]|nr:NAD(P)H-hydrate dehydratase [Caldisericia bacterium]
MKVVDTEQIKELDRRAVEEFKINPEILMENASLSAVYLILKKINNIKNRHFLIFCGTGNNGGDGFAIGRKIHSLGGDIKFILLGDENKLTQDAKVNFERVKKIGITILNNPDIKIIKYELENCEIVIDAIFGTGLKREIEGYIKEVIELINNSKKFILSVDIPSGINGDNGIEMGISVNADVVVTFGLPKIGNLIEDGSEKTKELYLSYISYPQVLYEDVNSSVFINEPIEIKNRKKNTYKKDYGDTLFISGSKKYFGAPYFSSYSFLKSGGGYSRLASVKEVIKSVSINAKEIVFYSLKENEDGTISKENEEFLLNLSKEVKFIVIGPGVGLNEDLEELIKNLTIKIERPLLIDGDGLTLISKNKEVLKQRKFPTILTPHLGEFSRLTQIPKETLRKEKIRILKEFSKEYNSYVILKGFHSLIATPDERVFINLSGNPCMATAGMGDVLDGIIPAMYGIGFNIEESIRMGVFVHGFCGDLLKEKFGENGVVANQMIDYLPLALKEIKENFESVKKKYSIEVIL